MGAVRAVVAVLAAADRRVAAAGAAVARGRLQVQQQAARATQTLKGRVGQTRSSKAPSCSASSAARRALLPQRRLAAAATAAAAAVKMRRRVVTQLLMVVVLVVGPRRMRLLLPGPCGRLLVARWAHKTKAVTLMRVGGHMLGIWLNSWGH